MYLLHGGENGILANRCHNRFSKEFSDGLYAKYLAKLWVNRFAALSRRLGNIIDNQPEILIYQPGKVGSTSLYKALLDAKVPCCHLHVFFKGEDYQPIKEMIAYAQKQIMQNGIKIITMVRDPIARMYSMYMQRFSRLICEKEEASIEEYITECMLKEKNEFDWFDDEILRLTGIDVFQYPFDKEKGYTIIKEGNIEILLMTMEKMNQNQQRIAQFCNLESLSIAAKNVGNDKAYKYVYEGIKKNVYVPHEVLEKYYKENDRIKHFYSDNDMECFYKKWSAHTNEHKK